MPAHLGRLPNPSCSLCSCPRNSLTSTAWPEWALCSVSQITPSFFSKLSWALVLVSRALYMDPVPYLPLATSFFTRPRRHEVLTILPLFLSLELPKLIPASGPLHVLPHHFLKCPAHRSLQAALLISPDVTTSERHPWPPKLKCFPHRSILYPLIFVYNLIMKWYYLWFFKNLGLLTH